MLYKTTRVGRTSLKGNKNLILASEPETPATALNKVRAVRLPIRKKERTKEGRVCLLKRKRIKGDLVSRKEEKKEWTGS